MAQPVFNLPDKAYQFWRAYSLNGIDYNLEHLQSSRHEFSHPTRNEKYTLYFTFSHHTFTRTPTNEELDEAELYYPFPPEDLRLFDFERYELSKHLPEIVATLPEQFCYHGGYSRYCSCKIKQADEVEVTYQVVYRVWKERGKIRFHIESAYPLSGGLSKVKKVNFWVICHNLLRDKKMPKPAR